MCAIIAPNWVLREPAAIRPPERYTWGAMMHAPTDARFWYHDKGHAVCDLCPRHCTLKPDQTGVCGVREFVGGRLLSTVYGRPAAIHVDPIEKKPLFHFLPGSRILSFGTVGCNMRCRCCQNWSLSCATDERGDEFVPPERIASLAEREGCQSVAFTYNDPTVFAEYAIDCAVACHQRGIATVAVTAGYITSTARDALYRHIDAANVDLKCFTEDGYEWLASGARLGPVLETLEDLVRRGVWLEVTTLVIPGFNDDDASMARQAGWMAEHLGQDVPLHLSAFHPDYRLRDRPRTPVDTLARLRRVARSQGLRYVYTGNVMHDEGAATFCPSCGTRLIVRGWHDVRRSAIGPGGTCPSCRTVVAGVFEWKGARPMLHSEEQSDETT